MLSDYVKDQPIAYNLLINEIKSNHISHAYLFDENDNLDSFNFVMSFVKEILCKDIDSLDDRNNICKRIDDGNYPEIKVIFPDGAIIKKKQILDLQQEFSTVAIEGTKRIYIIRDADKMRTEAANSMLKFLEEPDNNIIAILMTNNFNGVLSTIISRCQVIKLNNNNNNTSYEDELTSVAINFVKELESSGIKTILKTQELLFNYINVKDREKIGNFINKLINIYYDIMKIRNGNNIVINNYNDILVSIANNNSLNVILYKIEYLLRVKDANRYNVNSQLLIDDLIINVGGNYEGSWS